MLAELRRQFVKLMVNLFDCEVNKPFIGLCVQLHFANNEVPAVIVVIRRTQLVSLELEVAHASHVKGWEL